MQWKISRDRNFKVGDRVRSYDFPHDNRRRDCYVEGIVTAHNRSAWTVDILVTVDMWKGVDLRAQDLRERHNSPNSRARVTAPTGRGLIFKRHACFKLARVQQ